MLFVGSLFVDGFGSPVSIALFLEKLRSYDPLFVGWFLMFINKSNAFSATMCHFLVMLDLFGKESFWGG